MKCEDRSKARLTESLKAPLVTGATVLSHKIAKEPQGSPLGRQKLPPARFYCQGRFQSFYEDINLINEATNRVI
jgi:hypothetical protein